jgi:hypothetical protein
MKVWQYITGGLLALVVVVQFIPNELPAVETSNAGDIIQSGIVSEDVAVLLKKSCYSCHSNETDYPWYSYVAPSSWLVAKDVREGREELNFSTWTSYSMMDKLAKLDDIVEEVKEGEMPMEIYTLIHPSAKLDVAQRQMIISWAEATMDVVAEEDTEE